MKKFVEEGGLSHIRTALRLELNDKHVTSADLHKYEQTVSQHEKGLFEPYEEKASAREMESDKSKWTEDYFDSQVVYFKTNFSKKRWDHLVSVRDYLIKEGKF